MALSLIESSGSGERNEAVRRVADGAEVQSAWLMGGWNRL
jgi:hypothetical protein